MSLAQCKLLVGNQAGRHISYLVFSASAFLVRNDRYQFDPTAKPSLRVNGFVLIHS